MIKVSVIIPVYNVEKYLRQCMDSVLNQTLKEIEIICVNDGATDGSAEILEEYAKKDSRVQVIVQKNAGAGAARNNGMAAASGKYLSFLDADDFFEPDMLEKAYELAEKDQADFVVYKSDQFHTDKNEFVQVSWVVREKELPPYQPFHHRQMTDNIFKVFVGWAWDKLYRKEFVDKHGLRFQEQRTSNDMLFVFGAVALAERISVLPEVMVHQRRDAEDSLSKTRENSWWCFYDALIALRELLKKNHLYGELAKDYINYALHFTLWNYNTLAESTKPLLKEKLQREWLEELGIKGKDREYFYNKKEYDQYQELFGDGMLSVPVPKAVSENLPVVMKTADKKVTLGTTARIKKTLRKIVPTSRTYADKKFGDINRALMGQLKEQQKVIQEQKRMLQDSKKMLNELRRNIAVQNKLLGELKLDMYQEFERRDNWAVRAAENKRMAAGRSVWVIKCPAPGDASKVRWGDYPFAVTLKRELEALGVYAVVDTREDWSCEEGADVVLVLRGCHFYRPDRRNTGCLYIMWNISHPAEVTPEEYQLYDVVCVGSRHYAKKIQEKVTVPVFPLLQCTDTKLFYPPKEERYDREYIFIGNSRGIARKSVMWSIQDDLPLCIWGSGWNTILKYHMDLIEAPFIENSQIPELYRTSKVALNDHWDDMREMQFVNNRIFDSLACGLPVISDTCEELRDIFPEAVLHYSNKEEFRECVRQIEENYGEVKQRVLEQWDLIKEQYSFEARARELVEIAEKYKHS